MDDGFEDLLGDLEAANPTFGGGGTVKSASDAAPDQDFDSLLDEACGDISEPSSS